jgi:hypothetical protein
MPDDRKPSPLELGLYARAEAEPRITLIEIIAGVMTLVWLLAVLFFGFSGAGEGAASGVGGFARSVLAVLAVLLPVALIWVVAVAARSARTLRQEANRLQASIDAMRIAYVEQQQSAALNIKPEIMRRFEELLAAQGVPDVGQTATFTSLRALAPPETRAAMTEAVDPAADPEAPQPTLAFAQPEPRDPISVADFIKAMNFPENEHDKEGFRTLRRALEDPGTERLIRASQDVLTLMSQDGIYMDDLRPDRSRPEVWRRFAQGRARPDGRGARWHQRPLLPRSCGGAHEEGPGVPRRGPPFPAPFRQDLHGIRASCLRRGHRATGGDPDGARLHASGARDGDLRLGFVARRAWFVDRQAPTEGQRPGPERERDADAGNKRCSGMGEPAPPR